MTPSYALSPQTAQHLAAIDRFLVPEQPNVMAYFVDRLFPAHNLRERLLRHIARFSPTPLSRVLLSVRGGPHVSGQLHSLDAGNEATHLNRAAETLAVVLDTNRTQFLADTPLEQVKDPVWISLADYPGQWRHRVMAFIFTEKNDIPVAVLKARPADTAGNSLRDEWTALQQLRQRLSPRLRAYVPLPYKYGVCDGIEALLFSAFPGRSAYVEMRGSLNPRRRIELHFGAAGQWLADFHSETRHSGQAFDLIGLEHTVLNTICDRFDISMPPDYQGLDADCERSPIALVAGHGDFWARNLLITDGGMLDGIVDWEHFRAAAPPFDDLFNFAITYGQEYAWSLTRGIHSYTKTDAFDWTFITDTVLSRQVKTYLSRYCSRTGLQASLLARLLPIYLLSRAYDCINADVPISKDEECEFWLTCYRMLTTTTQSVFSG